MDKNMNIIKKHYACIQGKNFKIKIAVRYNLHPKDEKRSLIVY